MVICILFSNELLVYWRLNNMLLDSLKKTPCIASRKGFSIQQTSNEKDAFLFATHEKVGGVSHGKGSWVAPLPWQTV